LNLSGATGSVLDRSLSNLGKLIDQSIVDVRLAAGLDRISQQFKVDPGSETLI